MVHLIIYDLDDNYCPHLYLVNDDKIIDGDWYLGKGNSYVHNCNIDPQHKSKYKKIIATTDTRLIGKRNIEALPNHTVTAFFNNYKPMDLTKGEVFLGL